MQPNNFIKGLIAGAALGAAAITMVNPPDASDFKRMNRGANRAWTTVGTTVGSIVDGVVGTFK